MSRVVNPTPQYLDSSGDPLAAGKAYFYESGTNTLKTTYADSSETIPNSNPVILAADGRLPNVFFSGAARMVLTDSDSVQIFDRDPLGADSLGGNFSDWDNTTIYSSGDIVIASDGKYYVSLISGNQSNDPTTTPTAWLEVKFINVWNTNKTFNLNDIAQASDGLLYRSLVGSNTANDPVSSPAQWGYPIKQAQTANIADGAITEVKLATDSVSTVKIQDDAVTTDKILDANVTTSKINDNSITTLKISDDAVTLGKLSQGTVGGLISYDLSQDPTELIPGTSDHILTSNGAGATPTYKALDISKDTSPQLGGFLDPNGNYIGNDVGTNITDSATPTIPNDGDYFEFSGTTTVTSLNVTANRNFSLKCTGVRTFTASASIVTQDGADITTSAGEVVSFQSVSNNIVQVTSSTPISVATQAQQEAGTATDVFITPENQKFNQSATQAWAKFHQNGTQALDESFNITSITDSGIGISLLTFINSFSNVNYDANTGCSFGTGGNYYVLAVDALTTVPTVSAVNTRCGTTNTTAAFDSLNATITVSGDLV